MKSNNLISIIMTCSNGEPFLHEAVKSILDQTYSNWELIFYDNNSTDKSEIIIKNFNDPRIKYFRSNILVNLGSIRKLAYDKCQGNFICFLDVDDYWSNHKLEKQIKIFEMNENIDVVCSNYYKIKNHTFIKNKTNLFRGYCQNEIILSYINGITATAWLTLMIKRSSIDKLEYSFDDKTHISSDFDLIIRLSIFSNFDFTDEYLAYYRIHQNNESKNQHKEISELIYIINKYQKNKTISSLFFIKTLHTNFILNIFYSENLNQMILIISQCLRK